MLDRELKEEVMGLSSLIKVAQGKNAENVSFEDSFLKLYNEAVIRKDRAEKQEMPKDSFRPSSMSACDRMLFHAYRDELEEQEDTALIEICTSGTDRHTRIQNLVADMEEVKILDLEEIVKEANRAGINTKFLGWNEDKTEGRCKNEDLKIYFQPDGVINFKGKDCILEVKTESTYKHTKRVAPELDHKWQVTCYGMGLGIDYVLFVYEDRNFCGKKVFLWKITDEMKQSVQDKIKRVTKALETNTVPDTPFCNECPFCKYKKVKKLTEQKPKSKPKAKTKTTKKAKAPTKSKAKPKTTKATAKTKRGAKSAKKKE